MKVFVNHSESNKPLARRILRALERAGLEVWDDERDTYPSDNWATVTGEALEQADAMVVLLTPEALDSLIVHRNISFALVNLRFKNRLIPVLAGVDRGTAIEKVGWIAHHLEPITIPEFGAEDEGINQITQALQAVA
jgi:hypothetical protein